MPGKGNEQETAAGEPVVSWSQRLADDPLYEPARDRLLAVYKKT